VFEGRYFAVPQVTAAALLGCRQGPDEYSVEGRPAVCAAPETAAEWSTVMFEIRGSILVERKIIWGIL
jgi:hypothetical protein